MAKEGSTIGGLMDVLGTAISIGLQYGVPLEVFVNKFAHSRFEPAGFTKNPDIPIAKSIADYIFRWLGMEFIPGYREANAPKRPSAETEVEPASTAAPMLKVNGLRTATIADLEHAEAVMGAGLRTACRPLPARSSETVLGDVPGEQDRQFAHFQSEPPLATTAVRSRSVAAHAIAALTAATAWAAHEHKRCRSGRIGRLQNKTPALRHIGRSSRGDF